MADKYLIVGNGFDLDFGYKTRYKDFIESRYWPLREGHEFTHSGLAKYIQLKVNSPKNWCDLEALIDSYLKQQNLSKINVEYDKTFFLQLKKSLTDYLNNEIRLAGPYAFFDKSLTLSRKVLRWLGTYEFNRVYSFNYTDFNQTMELELNNSHPNIPTIYLHGELSKDNIILGTSENLDNEKTRFQREFLLKSWDPQYHHHDLSRSLSNASTIIFFGLSFSNIDNIYFTKFFTSLKNGEMKEPKLLVFFTFDDSSLTELKRNITSMDIDIGQLMSQAHTYFIKTHDELTERSKIQEIENILQQEIIDKSIDQILT